MSYDTANKIAALIEALPIVARTDVAEYLVKLSPDLAEELGALAYKKLHEVILRASESFDDEMAEYDMKMENAASAVGDRLADVHARLEKLQRALDADVSLYDLCTMSLDDLVNAQLTLEDLSKSVPCFGKVSKAFERLGGAL